MDVIDLKILKEFLKNCRITYSAIAHELGVSPTTIKNHVNQLKNEGILYDFVIELNFDAVGARRILILLDTNHKEDRQFFSDKIGNNENVERITPLNDGRYLTLSTCQTVDDLSQMDKFLKKLTNVKSVTKYPLREGAQRRLSFTKMELEIIQYLITNPRCPSNKVAKMINRSTKGVRLAINRLVDSGSILFTARYKFPKYFVIIRNEKGSLSFGKTIEWLKKEFNCIWEVFVSSIESMLFITFAVDRIFTINHIHRRINAIPFLSFEDAAICEPTIYYDNLRTKVFEYLTENGELPYYNANQK